MKSAPALSDQELIAQARSGSESAFRELVLRYEQQVAATVIGMLGPGEEAEDVGQEVFIRFYRALDKFRGEASLGTYLTRIAINLSLNSLKKRKRRQWLSYFSGHEDETRQIVDESDNADRRDTQALVRQGLQQLEPAFRAVVVLRLIEGYSTRETADILNIPSGTVLSRLARAQKKLKSILQPLLS